MLLIFFQSYEITYISSNCFEDFLLPEHHWETRYISLTFCTFYGSLFASKSAFHFFSIIPEGPHCHELFSIFCLSSFVLTLNRIHPWERIWKTDNCCMWQLQFSFIHLRNATSPMIFPRKRPTKARDKYSGKYVNSMSFSTVNEAEVFLALAHVLLKFL